MYISLCCLVPKEDSSLDCTYHCVVLFPVGSSNPTHRNQIMSDLLHTLMIIVTYRGIHEKGSEDVVSAVCYIIYTIYLSICTQTDETTSPEPFSRIPLYLSHADIHNPRSPPWAGTKITEERGMFVEPRYIKRYRYK